MIKNLKEFKEHVVSCHPQEACGVLIDGIFVPYENVHTDPINFFAFSEEDSYNVLKLDNYAIIHSHTGSSKEDRRTPSKEDMEGREATGVSWGIVHCDGENVSEILWFGSVTFEPYIGRDYISNVYDCFTLARDFIYAEFGKDVGLHPRPPDWESWNPYYIERKYRDTGFEDVTGELQCGDVVLFAVGSSRINHIGIYLGEDRFLHHLYNQKSSEDRFSKWKRQYIKAIRIIK